MTQPKYPPLQSAVLSFKILERSTPPAKPNSQPVRSQCCRQYFHRKSNIKWLTKEDESSLTSMYPLLRNVSFSGFRCSAPAHPFHCQHLYLGCPSASHLLWCPQLCFVPPHPPLKRVAFPLAIRNP